MHKQGTGKFILSLESSCDETAAAVLKFQSPADKPEILTLSSVIRSQAKLHSKMGGVVPEAAARAHVKNILPVTQKALAEAEAGLNDIDYLAVTAGPGLVPSLIVGVEFAKALSLASGKPLVPVNHLEGHLYSHIKDVRFRPKEAYPMVSLIASGGHTMLVLMESLTKYKVLGQTVDDAAGEAFDKVAKLLSLPYPGGPQVSRLAKKGKPSIAFPRPMINSKDYNFSFAGLKTAVLYHLKEYPAKNQKAKADVCASFQEAALEVLVAKTARAARQFQAKSISLSGGVSANESLRKKMAAACQKDSLKLFTPPKGLATDNAEMIGLAAAIKISYGFKPISYRHLKANPNMEL